MKPKLQSAYICVRDMKRALDFYQEFLDRGFTKKTESLYMFDVDGFRLFLFDNIKENEEKVYGSNCLLSFEVQDAMEVKKRIEDLQLKIVFPMEKILDNWVFEFLDTEGNCIEVFSKI